MNILTHIWDCSVCLAICVMTFVMPFTSQASRQSIVHTENFDIGDFSIDNFVSPSGDTYTKLSWANTFSTGEVGQPELLVRYIRFLVPDNACDFSVSVVEASLNSHINLEYPLYPVQDKKPMDNYFSDLTGNGWSVFKDSSGQYVCDLDATKYQPSIYVGRLLCHTDEQVSNYVSKLILYESNPGRGNSSYLDKTTLTVQYDGRMDYQATLSAMQSCFQNVGLMKDIIIDDETKSRYPTGEMMLQAVNTSGYSSLMGHGEPGTIACSGKSRESWRWQYISALDSYHNISETEGETTIKNHCDGNGIDLMTNYDTPSVIYSMGCTTSPFDLYEKVIDGNIFKYDLPHTMPSSYTVGGRYGGVAFLGNTRNGYWPTSPKLEQLFLESIKKYPKTGIAEAISKYSFLSHNFVRHAHNLIGDPEFELWRKSPTELNVNINWHDSNITFTGTDLDGCRVILNDGEENIRVVDCKNMTPVLSHLSESNCMEAVSVLKTGFLPIVILKCQNQCLDNVEKSFVVRTAEIGTNINSNMTSGSVEITGKSKIDIYAIDKIRCHDGLSIGKNSSLNLSCDNDIIVTGCSVYSGGSMNMNAKTIVLSSGFSVAKGGSLKITK